MQVGAALEALVATPGTRLRSLQIRYAPLGDAACGPLIDALPRSPRLQRLTLCGCGLSPAFGTERLLPSARAATRLVELYTLDDIELERVEQPAAAEAQELAASRKPAFFYDDERALTDDDEV